MTRLGSGRESVWMALVCGWVVVIVTRLSEASARANGAQVLAALLLGLLFAWEVLEAKRARRSMGPEGWVIVITIAVLVGGLNWTDLRIHGLMFNVSPIVVVLVSLFARGR